MVPTPSNFSARDEGTSSMDLFQLPSSYFHGARLEAMLGAGAMPRVLDGEQASAKGYLTVGLALTLAVGGK